jgi:hypothetical protein
MKGNGMALEAISWSPRDVIARITAINLELMRRKALDEDLD